VIDTAAADKAALAAQEAAVAAANAKAAAEIEWLGTCTSVHEIGKDRTQAEATRLKSRYVTTFGYDRWAKLCADSRR
jgi:hypothetical protein